jgi:hypothetical protein
MHTEDTQNAVGMYIDEARVVYLGRSQLLPDFPHNNTTFRSLQLFLTDSFQGMPWIHAGTVYHALPTWK